MAVTGTRDKILRKVALTDVAFGGECIGRLDNQVVFASYGVPGEEVVVEINESKRDYLRGRVIDVIRPSPERVAPPCPVFGRCGGCQWQHIEYQAQLGLKRKIVNDQLRRIGDFDAYLNVGETFSAPSPWHYRNHARFMAQQGRLGFALAGTQTFLPVDECPIVDPAINRALAALQGRVPRHIKAVTVRCGVNTGQLLIQPKLGGLVFPTGQKYVEEVISGRRFRIAGASFFQINTAQAERMLRYVCERLALKDNDTLADIYCGVGAFGLVAAGEVAQVIGVEESAGALRDAGYNARELKNVRFIQGTAEKVLVKMGEHIDAAIIDPPRAGCKREVIDALRRLHPARIIYVSCDPATLARDLRLFCADGRFRITDIQPIDMFPQTYHIETVVTLQAS